MLLIQSFVQSSDLNVKICIYAASLCQRPKNYITDDAKKKRHHFPTDTICAVGRDPGKNRLVNKTPVKSVITPGTICLELNPVTSWKQSAHLVALDASK